LDRLAIARVTRELPKMEATNLRMLKGIKIFIAISVDFFEHAQNDE
jgi:hypothetical protein